MGRGMPPKKRREKYDLHVTRPEANMDRACDMAFKMAMMHFGADEEGELNVENWVRSQDTLHVEFVGYERRWHEHTYTFRTWVDNAFEEYGDEID